MENFALQPHPKYGFPQIQPTPSKEVIDQYYAAEFYSSNYSGQVNNSSLEVQQRDAAFLEGWRDDIIELMTRELGRPLPEIRLLDLGCGWCEFIKNMAALGTQCVGVDPAAEAIERGKALGLDVRIGGVEEVSAFGSGEKFDVVTLFNVLEHVADPEATVRDIRSVLAENGLLIIEVPNEFNALQLAARELHELSQWWVKPPAHLNYFSKDSLSAMLTDCGYEVCDIAASFPLELFLLMGKQYIGNARLGRECHEMRVTFEVNMRKMGRAEELRKLYRSLAELGMGRQIRIAAKRA